MKRKNLILSLICSIALTIGLVTFTVISLLPKQSGATEGGSQVSDKTEFEQTNEERNGTAELPYLIYDAESFETLVVKKYLDENGKYIDYTQKDADGVLAYPELAEGLYYELASDIDLAGSNISSIFNKGIAFNGTIDGKNFAIKNLTVEVTKENLKDYMYEASQGFRAHIAFFGKLDGAKIVNLALTDVNVTVKTEVLDYLRDASTTFVQDNGAIMFELVSSTLAGLAFESEIDVDVQGKLDAFAYHYKEAKDTFATNAIGGLVAATVDTDISNSKANIEMNLAGKHYYAGGLVGKAYNTVANAVDADTKITAAYNEPIWVGGLFGYVQGIAVDAADVSLNITQNGERIAEDVMALLNSSAELDEEVMSAAGIVAFVRANDETQKATIKNVNVIANVAIDGIYAGAIVEVFENIVDGKEVRPEANTVYIENVSLASNVDTLKAAGFAFVTNYVDFKSKEACELIADDITITGNVRLSEKAFFIFVQNYDVDFVINEELGDKGYQTLTVTIGKDLDAKVTTGEVFLKISLIAGDKLTVA